MLAGKGHLGGVPMAFSTGRKEVSLKRNVYFMFYLFIIISVDIILY